VLKGMRRMRGCFWTDAPPTYSMAKAWTGKRAKNSEKGRVGSEKRVFCVFVFSGKAYSVCVNRESSSVGLITIS